MSKSSEKAGTIPTHVIGFRGYGLAKGRDFHADVGGPDPSVAAARLAYELMTCITSYALPALDDATVEAESPPARREAEVTMRRALDTFCVLRVLQLYGFLPPAERVEVGSAVLGGLMPGKIPARTADAKRRRTDAATYTRSVSVARPHRTSTPRRMSGYPDLGSRTERVSTTR